MRVIIADDELLLRQGLRWVLERMGAEIVAEIDDADDVVAATTQLRPDILITDIRMPPTMRDDGLQAALRVRAQHPEIGVLVLSQHVRREYAEELLAVTDARAAGGVGYLLKQRVADVDEFADAVAAVRSGGTVLDPDVAEIMTSRARRRSTTVLTPRQHEVIALVSRGYSNARIAAALSLTERAVVKHIGRIYDALSLPEDLEINRRVVAVTRYLTDGAG